MLPAHKRFFVLEQGVGSIVFNLPINAAFAFFAFRGAASVPLWGQQSIASETTGTTFFLPLITCGIVTVLVRRRVRAGGIEPWTGASFGVHWLPQRTFWRSLVIGVLTTILVAPPTLAGLSGLGVHQQSFWAFVAFKAVFASLLGVVVTPLVALWAMVK